MKVAAIQSFPTETLAISIVDKPAVSSPDDVLLRVQACGICGTDLHIMAGASYKPRLPFILGHEPVGTVIETGDRAKDWHDQRVTITLFTGCGRCHHCNAGDERLCPDLRSITGVHEAPGGFAEYLVVHAAQLIRVPDQLSSVEVATLVDAGATAMNAAQVALDLGTSNPIVVGAGPVGWLVAERLRLTDLDPIVVEPHDGRRKAIQSLGFQATSTLELADESGADAVLDCAGHPEVLPWALDHLSPHGSVIVVGYGRMADFDSSPIARKELCVRGVRSGAARHLREALNLSAEGSLRLPSIRTWPLDDINDAFTALQRGDVVGKAVVTYSLS